MVDARPNVSAFLCRGVQQSARGTLKSLAVSGRVTTAPYMEAAAMRQTSDRSRARRAALRGRHATEVGLPSQSGLDTLVAQVAVELMSVTASSMTTSVGSVLKLMNDFFDVDTSFLRRNDFRRDVSVLVVEWPPREFIPDPDPLGEVPFGHDPQFDLTRDFTAPYLARPESTSEAYRQRVLEASGIPEVSLAMVPLNRGGATVGVLGFVNFGDRIWTSREINALQAVASLLVQVEARVEAESRLTYQADHDELTGLANHRLLFAELRERLNRSETETVGLMLFNVDGFKTLNDFLGRGAGDALLVSVAERLRKTVKPAHFVARLAGDEFVVVLEGPNVESEAMDLADALLHIFPHPIELRGHQVSRTACVGVAFGTGLSVTPESLLEQADVALQTAKFRGSSQRAVFDTELREAVVRRSQVALELRDAIENGGLLLHYQPEVDLRTGELLALEALVRWDHPVRGILTAGEFITVAEEIGLIADLDRLVMAEACRQMAAWRTDYPSLRVQVRVNISPAELSTRGVVDLVERCLADNHLPGSALCLEITEHAVVTDVAHTVDVLEQLKRLGVSLAIDDFGTGYSSMSQLKSLPVDVLKIDQSFVAGLGHDADDNAIVELTVRLAASFGLEVIGEGVETPEMASELLRLGCTRAQGFLLCRPKNALDLIPVLERGGLPLASFA
jgi:diguanylate cyclase (GGDEF)-like protein